MEGGGWKTETERDDPGGADTPSLQTGCRRVASELDRGAQASGDSGKFQRQPCSSSDCNPLGETASDAPAGQAGTLDWEKFGPGAEGEPGCCLERRHGPAGPEAQASAEAEMAFRAGDQGRRRGRTERPKLTRTRLMRVDTTGGKPEPSLQGLLFCSQLETREEQ